MEMITHREMRNRSGELLRRVEAGESFEVTNHGRPAARIVPTGSTTFEELIRRGEVRAATTDTDSLRNIDRATSTKTAAEIIDDVRGVRG